jgi:hypothetical protein
MIPSRDGVFLCFIFILVREGTYHAKAVFLIQVCLASEVSPSVMKTARLRVSYISYIQYLLF